MSFDRSGIELILLRLEQLAEQLTADPDGHVRRSVRELRLAFDSQSALEPAVARVCDGVQMLRGHNRDGARREFQRRSPGVERLQSLVEHELLPQLRQAGFEV